MLGASGLNPSLNAEYCREAKALFMAMDEQPDNFKKRLINRAIKRLIINGDWDKLSGLFVMASHTQQSALLNWKNPSQKLTLVGSPQFEVDKGITTAVGKYIDTGINPATTAEYAADDALIMLYINSNVAEDNADIDLRVDVFSRITLTSRNTSDNGLFALNSQASAFSSSVSTSVGCYILMRRTGGNAFLFKNKNILSSRVDTGSIPNKNILIGKRAENSNHTTKRYASFAIGSGETDNVFLNDIVTEYLTAIGAN